MVLNAQLGGISCWCPFRCKVTLGWMGICTFIRKWIENKKKYWWHSRNSMCENTRSGQASHTYQHFGSGSHISSLNSINTKSKVHHKKTTNHDTKNIYFISCMYLSFLFSKGYQSKIYIILLLILLHAYMNVFSWNIPSIFTLFIITWSIVVHQNTYL